MAEGDGIDTPLPPDETSRHASQGAGDSCAQTVVETPGQRHVKAEFVEDKGIAPAVEQRFLARRQARRSTTLPFPVGQRRAEVVEFRHARRGEVVHGRAWLTKHQGEEPVDVGEIQRRRPERGEIRCEGGGGRGKIVSGGSRSEGKRGLQRGMEPIGARNADDVTAKVFRDASDLPLQPARSESRQSRGGRRRVVDGESAVHRPLPSPASFVKRSEAESRTSSGRDACDDVTARAVDSRQERGSAMFAASAALSMRPTSPA